MINGLSDISAEFTDSNTYSNNQNLFVSAENSLFNNTFGGPMVIEVVIIEPNISRLDLPIGEPDVKINGKALRMAQTMDGRWSAYFADRTMATRADQTNLTKDFTDTEGAGLDFGGFCSSTTTDTDIIGTSGGFPETVGFAIARNMEGEGKSNDDPEVLEVTPTQGTAVFVDCVFIGPNDNPDDISKYRAEPANHVVRNAKQLNTNSGAAGIGQIGLVENTWPIIQLYDFTVGGNVEIIYNKGGDPQMTILRFDDLEDLAIIKFDAKKFPRNAELHLTLYDNQLNIDPTDKDSWTFDVTPSSLKTIYQMYDKSGNDDSQGNGDTEIDIFSSLTNLGYGKNGFLEITADAQNVGVDVVENDESSLIVGSTPTKPLSFPVTLVETESNSGIFVSYDPNDNSNIDIASNAKRDTSATIKYGAREYTILTGSFDATLKFILS